MSDEYERFEVETVEQLRTWLRRHHASSPGAWLVTYKRADPRYVARGDVVDELLCFGWIDSLPRAVDAVRTSILITPRKPGSRWSRVNREKVDRLTASGRMHRAGLTAVERSRADGTWEALDAVEDLAEPEDLATALDRSPAARREWDGFPRSARRAILEWILAAKKPETRAARVGETVAQAAVGVRANQWRQPKRPAS
jgi:uncharacterized protein YdeI (YjbR/CyaY-like superfamily)